MQFLVLRNWREGKIGRYGDLLIIFSHPHFLLCNITMWDFFVQGRAASAKPGPATTS
jgi:hypothetical protein